MSTDPAEIPAWIRATQKKVGKIIQKPKLTSQLLARPPFRFIHDIVFAIIDCTGFGLDIFSDQERDASKLSDKSLKIRFLEKLILGVSHALDDIPIDVNPGMIGLEPEKTNDLLVCLCDAACQYSHAALSVNAEGQADQAFQDVLSLARLLKNISLKLKQTQQISEANKAESIRLFDQINASQ